MSDIREMERLPGLVGELESLEAETFEIQDFVQTGEEMMGATSSTSSTSTCSSCCSCTSCGS